MLRRAVLATAGTAFAVTLLLAAKPHHSAAIAAPTVEPAPTPSGSAPAAAAGSGPRTVSGDTVQTQYGPVQVEIHVTGHRLSSVTVLQQPTDRPRDEEINSYALPELTQEALAAQGAKIDSVSGATYTSEGYITSLQSALDRAGL